MVDVHHVGSTTDSRSITVSGVVVAAIELIQDQRSAISANVLNLRQLFIGHKMSGGIAGVGREEHRRATSDFLGDLVGVNVIVIFLGQGHGNRSDLDRPLLANHFNIFLTPSRALTFLKSVNISEYAE